MGSPPREPSAIRRMRRCDLAPRTRSGRHEHQMGRARPGRQPSPTAASRPRREGGPGHVVERLALAGAGRDRRRRPDRNGWCGRAGDLRRTHGRIRFFTNLPGPWAGHPLGAPLCEALGVPVRLVNDARAFTLAEARVGAGKGCPSLIGVTLGTGVGGGLVIDGRLVLGLDGTAGEIGHLVIDCAPGRRSAAAATPAASRRSWRAAARRGRGHRDGGRCVRRRRARRPARARRRGAWIDYLAIGLANLVTVLTPERIVLGGGVASARRASSCPCGSASKRTCT